MAICTKCGSVVANEDADKHVCDPLDVPAKGTFKKMPVDKYSTTTGTKI